MIQTRILTNKTIYKKKKSAMNILSGFLQNSSLILKFKYSQYHQKLFLKNQMRHRMI